MKIERIEKDGIPYVIIPVTEYTRLEKDRDILAALYATGVDNWEGYYDALANIDSESESEEDIYGS